MPNSHGYSIYPISSQEELEEKLEIIRKYLKIDKDYDVFIRHRYKYPEARTIMVNKTEIGWGDGKEDKKLWPPQSWESFCSDLGIPFKIKDVSECICERHIVVNCGCKCGAFQRELEMEEFC